MAKKMKIDLDRFEAALCLRGDDLKEPSLMINRLIEPMIYLSFLLHTWYGVCFNLIEIMYFLKFRSAEWKLRYGQPNCILAETWWSTFSSTEFGIPVDTLKSG